MSFTIFLNVLCLQDDTVRLVLEEMKFLHQFVEEALWVSSVLSSSIVTSLVRVPVVVLKKKKSAVLAVPSSVLFRILFFLPYLTGKLLLSLYIHIFFFRNSIYDPIVNNFLPAVRVRQAALERNKRCLLAYQ